MKQGFPFDCVLCGTTVDDRWNDQTNADLLRTGHCFTCNFWMEKVRWREQDDPSCLVTDQHWHYRIEPDESASWFRGFGGQRFTVSFNDGRKVETRNLWCQGEIPERFREALPPNGSLS